MPRKPASKMTNSADNLESTSTAPELPSSGATESPSLAPDPPLEGGCACGSLRYRLLTAPMFVHCCHCTRCQRETGSPFAHHAMIEFTRFEILTGEPERVLVPTDSGGKHWVARCPTCKTALWNEHGSHQPITRYVRVGTLDEPSRCPPLAHIFVRSKQPWLVLPPEAPAYAAYYDAMRVWPEESLARYTAAKAARAAEKKTARPARKAPH